MRQIIEPFTECLLVGYQAYFRIASERLSNEHSEIADLDRLIVSDVEHASVARLISEESWRIR